MTPGKIVDKGQCELSAPSSSSGSGFWIVTSWLLSTGVLGARPAALADLYQRWRVKKLRFRYNPQIGVTTQGRFCMGVSDDADGNAPTSPGTMAELNRSTTGPIYKTASITWKPKYEAWLWTKDLGLNEDRLEYPGVFYFATTGMISSLVVGFITVQYEIEYYGPCTSTTALARMKNRLNPDPDSEAEDTPPQTNPPTRTSSRTLPTVPRGNR